MLEPRYEEDRMIIKKGLVATGWAEASGANHVQFLRHALATCVELWKAGRSWSVQHGENEILQLARLQDQEATCRSSCD